MRRKLVALLGLSLVGACQVTIPTAATEQSTAATEQSFGGTAAAATSQEEGTGKKVLSVAGIYSDEDALKKAVEIANQTVAPGRSTDGEKNERRQTISQELSKAETKEAMQKVAEKYGLIIYYPDVSYEEPGVQSSPHALKQISPVTFTYDPYEREWEISGYIEWENEDELRKDVPLFCAYECDVGRFDAISIYLSNWPADAYITYYYTYGRDRYGNNFWDDHTAEWAESNGKRVVTVSNQDRWKQSYADMWGWYYSYDWWRVRQSFWVANFDPATIDGTAHVIYTHTWDETGVTGVDFELKGGAETRLSIGVVVHFNTLNHQWIRVGPEVRY